MDDVFAALADQVSGSLITCLVIVDDHTLAFRMITDTIKKYNRDAELYGATAFDGIKLIALAIQNGDATAEGIKKALYKVKDFPGVTGKTTFDSDGIAVKPVNFTILKNGKFVPFKKELMMKPK